MLQMADLGNDIVIQFLDQANYCFQGKRIYVMLEQGKGNCHTEGGHMANIVHELRLGYVTQLYYNILGIKDRQQLEILNEWFGELIVIIGNKDTTSPKGDAASFEDTQKIIQTYIRHGRPFIGNNPRVKYICGKLVGTSKSNKEKERYTAEIVQKNIAYRICVNVAERVAFEKRVIDRINQLDEEQQERFHEDMLSFTKETAQAYEQKSEYDKIEELFPFDNEVFEGIIENVVDQLVQPERKGLVNAWMWLLLGSTLRNACGRVLRTYDSLFAPLCQVPTESGKLSERIECMINPDSFELDYLGEVHGERFPGIQWYCDICDAILNNQPGFDDHLSAWQCRKCGYINLLTESEIYNSKEDFRNHNKQ